MSRSRHNVLFRDETWQALEDAARERDTTVTDLLERAATVWLWLRARLSKPGATLMVHDEVKEQEIVIL
jgi:hypothetical protein